MRYWRNWRGRISQSIPIRVRIIQLDITHNWHIQIREETVILSIWLIIYRDSVFIGSYINRYYCRGALVQIITNLIREFINSRET